MAFPMKELDVHNELLGDHAKLESVYREEGYLFFRDVLDRDAVNAVREKYFSILVDDYGVVDPGMAEPVWNGTDVSDFPVKVPEIYGSGCWEQFTSDPKINGFFEDVVGEPLNWVPSTEYRLNPRSRKSRRTSWQAATRTGSSTKASPSGRVGFRCPTSISSVVVLRSPRG
ncbi:hypothetical protein P9209_00960 [Prescottella defluvii]|nr:hypothetical protein P9209_00960 [Prescottella defluvii]